MKVAKRNKLNKTNSENIRQGPGQALHGDEGQEGRQGPGIAHRDGHERGSRHHTATCGERSQEAETEDLIRMDGTGAGTTSNLMPREGVTNETSDKEK